MNHFLFTSESVSEGHPDKISDQISDAVLDAYLQQDPESRVACESMVSTDFICIAGEVSSKAHVDVEKVARDTVRRIGYTHKDIGFNADTAQVLLRLHEQSPDISQGVSQGEGLFKQQGAGDQGIMFGYASNENPEYMPMPIALAHRILQYLAQLRHSGELKNILPDSKSQVSVEYQDMKAVRLDTVVLSSQHKEDIQHEELEEMLVEQVIKKVIPKALLSKTRYLINPTGRFVVGGPHGDAGLTGRKIIVDTYGGWSRHGGGAFSGKDPSKVDRSAAYMARYCAKNIIAAGLADRCELQVSYAIGYPEPISIHVDSFGTHKTTMEEIHKRIAKHFDFSPAGIIERLALKDKERCYLDTAAYGHFGREGRSFTWEKTDLKESLQD